MDILNVDLIARSMPLLCRGAFLTLQVLISASLISMSLGITFGLLTSKRLNIWVVSALLEWLCFILRAVPFYVQLLIVYFVLPDLFQINMDVFVASVVSLGICSSGYVAQVVRGGLNAIPMEQWEAAFTLGFSRLAQIRYIILPQLIRAILPALTSELDAMVKSTAILSSIGLLELTRMGMNIVSREMEPLCTYLCVAVFYVLISGSINLASKYLERRFSYANS